ncbi:hypothetical protein BH09BAC3_BH09BAC3_34000 [soil metagenome]
MPKDQYANISIDVTKDTLVSILQRNSSITGKGITFIEGAHQEVFLSYQEIYECALQVLKNLQDAGLKPGDEIVFQLENNDAFLKLFWACMLGRFVAVPLAFAANSDHKMKVIKVWQTLSNPVLVCDQRNFNKIQAFQKDAGIASDMPFIDKDRALMIDMLLEGNGRGNPQKVVPDDIAFVQFSSGSTGDPKGVILTHKNLVVNTFDLVECSSATSADSTLSWMPLSHDMGLICIYLTGFLARMNQFLIPTALFIRRPLLWIDKASEHKVTQLYSPNFGLQYCLSAMKDEDEYHWDLSGVRVIYNGAEPISKRVCDTFLEKLSLYKLKETAMYPVYGLAEATVGVSIPRPPEKFISYRVDRRSINIGDRLVFLAGEDQSNAITFIDLGVPLTHCAVRICAEHDVILPENHVGRVQLKGSNVTTGYYNNRAATHQLLTSDGWARTGDLGVLVNGRLVITGREKNIVIVNGQNYYPQDIENSMLKVPSMELGKVVACGVERVDMSGEDLIAFVLFKKSLAEFHLLAKDIKHTVFHDLGLTIEHVVPVRKIPKTTSGKIQHFKLKEEYLKGIFKDQITELEAMSPESARIKDFYVIMIQNQITEILKELLHIPSISHSDDLFELGVNSIIATKLISHIHRDLNLNISLNELFDQPDTDRFTIEVIARFLNSKKADEKSVIPRLPVSPQYELSYAQRRLWLLEVFNDGKNPSSIPIEIVFREALDKALFDATWKILIQMHESLRTIFIADNDEVRQQIIAYEQTGFAVTYASLSNGERGHEELRHTSLEEARFIFDLARGPLVRVKVLTRNLESHAFITVHHIVSDGWSTGILIRDLFSVYDDLRVGKIIPESKTVIHYKEFASWQNRKTAMRFDDDKEFWLNTLRAPLPLLTMPTWNARPAVQSYRGKRLSFQFSQDSFHRLSRLSTAHESTLFMSLMSVLNILFFRYTGTTDIILGTSVADRSHPDVMGLVGYFLNVIPIRTSFEGTETFSAILDKTKKNILAAYKHQQYPFDKLVDELRLERDMSRSPVFDVVVLLHNYDNPIIPPAADLGKASHTRQVFETDNATSIVDLFFEFSEYNNQLFLNLRYNTELFTETQVIQLVQHFECLLTGVAARPTESISFLSMGTEREVQKFECGPSVGFDHTKGIIDCIEERAKHDPERIALEFEGNVFTYRELNHQANQLAHFLKDRKKIRAGEIVMVVMSRSDNFLICILALWKCEAIYLPLDTENPYTRIYQVAVDSKARSLICDQSIFTSDEIVQLNDTVEVIEFEGIVEAVAKETVSKVSRNYDPQDIAYIIYTSGSTGSPKGVMVQHVGMVNHILAKVSDLELSSHSIVAQNASQGFDISIWQLFVALLTGGKTIIYNREVVLHPARLMEQIHIDRVTILEVVPSYLTVLLELVKQESLAYLFASLNFLIITGEALSKVLVERWFNFFPGIKLMNAYGPTEASDDITHYIMERVPNTESIPIGRPVQNFSIYILDEFMNRVPLGVLGEIYVSGLGVGKGYLYDEAKTLASFSIDPFANHPTPMYKTGDIGRYLPSGLIEFHGRKDHQVKINGHRIELGEVENTLSSVNGIRQAVVLQRTMNGAKRQLVAFVVVAEEHAPNVETIRVKLRKRLPEYMVPTLLQVVPFLPVLSNGKIDRVSLAARDIYVSNSPAAASPTTHTEWRLMEIWKEVLSSTGVMGIDDNFFEIGGYSLLANQIALRVHKTFNVKLELRQVFLFPTIRTLAGLIIKSETKEYEPIVPVRNAEYYELSRAQMRMWILQQASEKQIAYNVSGSYVLEGEVDLRKFDHAIKAIVQRHEILRTTFIQREGSVYQKINSLHDLKFDIHYHDVSTHVHPEKDGMDQMSDAQSTVFDLETGPPLIIHFLKVSSQKAFFTIVMHHIVSDGWSRGIFEKEFINLYEQPETDYPVPVRLPEIQYKDYAGWQNKMIANGTLDYQKNYWIKQLKGDLPRINLSTTSVRPPVQSFRGDTLSFSMDVNLSQDIYTLSKNSGTTLFMTLVGLLSLVFYKRTSQRTLLLGTAVAGRNHKDLESQIGFFVNTLVLRMTIKEKQTFADFLNTVMHTVFDAFEHDAYPFDKLADDLNLSTDRSRGPIFDILVELHQFNQLDSTLDMTVRRTDFSLQPIDLPVRSSIFDINYIFYEREGGLRLDIRYNTDLFSAADITQLFHDLRQYTKLVAADPSALIESYSTSSVEEQLSTLPFRAGHVPGKSVYELVRERATGSPSSIAIECGNQTCSYAQLLKDTDLLSNFLIGRKWDGGPIVGLLMERSPVMIKSILALWRSGLAYLPIDGDYPLERIKYICNDAGIQTLMVSKRFIKPAHLLQWECESIKNLICVDSENIYEEAEQLNESMKKELWEYVGSEAKDEIEGGGWIDSYTGLPISQQEMKEYGDNVVQKLRPFLSKNTRVLEIGCASGITMFALAPLVKWYVGTDLSEVILKKDQQRIAAEGINNIELINMYAHEVDQLHKQDYDIIIINSVVQNFNGYNYLREVIQKCIGLMSSQSVLFVGDVMDLEKKLELVKSLEDFRNNGTNAGFKPKTEWEDELFIPRSFFDDLSYDHHEIHSVIHSEKIHTIANELTRFRYDTIIKVDKTKSNILSINRPRRKFQYDWTDVTVLAEQSSIPYSLQDSLAYVIYTSGSTGAPKGAMIEHGGMLNHLFAKVHDLNLEQSCVMAQTASHCFDISVWQFFAPLVVGGKVIIYSNEEVMSCEVIIEKIHDDRITVLELVPSYVLEVMSITKRTGNISWARSLSYLVVTGEVLNKRIVSDWLQIHPQIPLMNAYGPTEASDDITHFVITSIPEMETISIGSPVQNLRIYILDDLDQLCPPGVKGEICVSGVGVGRGYLNNPSLTDRVFVKDPFCLDDKVRMYRTGDLGMYRVDGSISFFGRRDHQVKIRGYRIELGEIEHKLSTLTGVREAVVVVEPNELGDILCAFITKVPTSELAEENLRILLKKLLPEYMIPSKILLMEAMPYGENGKIDRHALSQPGVKVNNSITGATNETEHELIEIWKDILNREHIGIDQSFFDIGGHSLKATRMVSHIFRVFESKVGLRDVFRFPTVRQLAAIIDDGRNGVRSIIQELDRKAYYQLSPAQKRIWILSQLNGIDAYVEHGGIHFTFRLNLDDFRKSLNEVINRHESLRTTFVVVDGEPLQKIHPVDQHNVRLAVVDLTASGEKGSRDISKLLNEQKNMVLNLEDGPLLSLVIAKIKDDHFTFLYSVHHILSDGWSGHVFIRDLLSLYDYHQGKIARLVPLSIHYKDYAAWQNKQLETGELDKQQKYWMGILSGDLPVLTFPTDFLRPALQTFNGARQTVHLAMDEVGAFNSLLRQQEATLFMGLLSVVNILLYRYTGQRDIVVGSPIAGREHPDLENQIGFYINMLCIRTVMNDSDNFNDVLMSVKDKTLGAFEHQSYPFDKLVNDLNLHRDISRSPLFDVMVVLHNTVKLWESGEHAENVTVFKSNTGISKFDLSFEFVEEGEGVKLEVEYNTDLFRHETIQRLLNHFTILFSDIAAGNLTPITQLAILSRAEHDFQVSSHEEHQGVESAPIHFISRLKDLTLRQSGSIAIICNDVSVTYGEIEILSDRLGAYLQTKYAVAVNDLIALKLKRSEWMVMAIIAVFKTGACYVPIDPEYPLARQRFIEEDSNCKLCIDDELLRTFLSLPDCFAIREVATSADDLAYVIYTSGSSGNPKGCMIEHRQLSGLLNNLDRHFQFSTCTRIAATTVYTFDISILEILGALYYGRQLVMYDENVLKDPTRLVPRLEADSIEFLQVTPSRLFQLLMINASLPKALRVLLVGGEALSIRVKRLLRGQDHCRKFNVYGPTETTIWSSADELLDDDDISIGKPFHTEEIYVLSSANQITPAGVTGELYIGGTGVCRGYLNQPALSAERFVDNPFRYAERMYRTGDLGRRRLDGSIEFVGRVDHQVKVRGHRIELGEIEFVLVGCHGVKQAAVIHYNHEDGSDEMIAYVTATDSDELEILAHLKKTLPLYMIPGRIVMLDRMPMTANEKIDRKSLPHPGVKQTAYTPPSSSKENILAAAWEEVLHHHPVGLNDNFFDLGGDSIKAVQIAANIRQRGLDLALKSIFTHPVLRDMVDEIGFINELIPQGREKGSVLLTNHQRFLLTNRDKGKVTMVRSKFLFFKETVSEEVATSIVQMLYERHDALRLSFQLSDDGMAQSYGESVAILETGLLDENSSVEKQLLTHIERVAGSMDVKGPLCHLALLNYASRSVLVIACHRLIIDDTSWNVILSDIDGVVQHLLLKKSYPSSPKTHSFKVWTETIAKNTKGKVLSSARGGALVARLPSENGRTKLVQRENTLSHYVISLDKKSTEQLLGSAHRPFNTTPDEILIAALQLSLMHVFDVHSVPVSFRTEGRSFGAPALDVSRTVGSFYSEYSFLLNVDHAEQLHTVVKRAKEIMRSSALSAGAVSVFAPPLPADDLPQILFHALSISFQSDAAASFEVRSIRSGETERRPGYEIEISSEVIDSVLHMRCAYNSSTIDGESIWMWCEKFKEQVVQLAVYCTSYNGEELTPSDLGYKDLSTHELEAIKNMFS